MEIDLNELERLANAAHKYNNFWFEKDDLEDLNIGSDDAALIARMSHDVVLELVRRLRESEKDAERLNFLERRQLEIDSSGGWNEDPTFGVTRVSGGRNDRKWTCLARGETLREAIDAAMQPSKGRKAVDAEREACAKVCDDRAEAWQAAHLAGQRAMQTRAGEVANKTAERILAANTHRGRTSSAGSFASGVAEDIGCDIRALEVKP